MNPISNWFNRKIDEKVSQRIEQKTNVIDGGFEIFSRSSMTNMFISAQTSYYLYEISDCVGDAVDRLAWAFSQIEPVLKHRKTGEIIKEHPALQLEKKPDLRITSEELRFGKMVSLCLAGEFIPCLLGNIKYEPTGMFFYPASNISAVQSPDGYINSMIATYMSNTKIHNRAINPNYYKYVYNDMTELSQITHLMYNRRRNSLRAQSPLERIYYQTLTKYFGHKHNAEILENGSRPGGLWKPKNSTMTKDQHTAMVNEVTKYKLSSSGIGRDIIAPVDIEYQNMLINTRDMDFANLLRECKNDIYQQFQIPLPLIAADTMTMNNYSNAVESFIDQSLLPRARFIWSTDGDFLLSRYKDGKDLEFVIDEKTIPALKLRLITQVKGMRDLSIFSQNELRTPLGYETLGDQGDSIYIPANLVVSGQDEYTDDNISFEGQQSDNQDDVKPEIEEENIDDSNNKE